MKFTKWGVWGSALAIMFSMGACSDDEKSDPVVPDDKGDQVMPDDKGDQVMPFDIAAVADDKLAATEAQTATLLSNCDFDGAAVQIESVYMNKAGHNSVDAQTAVERSIMGVIALTTRPEVQKVLKGLGFKVGTGTLSFENVWKNDLGIFNAMAAKKCSDDAWTYVTDALSDLVKAKSRDCGEVTSLFDASLTMDDIVDAALALKPELVSLGDSFKLAGDLLKDSVAHSNGGCGLSQIEFTAQDMYALSGVMYAAVAVINWLSNYDFDFSVSKAYQAACIHYDDCSERTELKNLLEPHLWKRTSKVRNLTGMNGIDALKQAATSLKLALNAPNPGNVLNLSTLIKSDIQPILDGIIDGSGDMSALFTPALTINLDKVFNDIIYRTEPLEILDCEYKTYGIDEIGEASVFNYEGIKNIQDYYQMTFVNNVVGNKLVEKSVVEWVTVDEWGSEYGNWYDVDYSMSDTYSVSVSDKWEDYDIFTLYNSKRYLEFYVCEGE